MTNCWLGKNAQKDDQCHLPLDQNVSLFFQDQTTAAAAVAGNNNPPDSNDLDSESRMMSTYGCAETRIPDPHSWPPQNFRSSGLPPHTPGTVFGPPPGAYLPPAIGDRPPHRMSPPASW